MGRGGVGRGEARRGGAGRGGAGRNGGGSSERLDCACAGSAVAAFVSHTQLKALSRSVFSLVPSWWPFCHVVIAVIPPFTVSSLRDPERRGQVKSLSPIWTTAVLPPLSGVFFGTRNIFGDRLKFLPGSWVGI